MPSSFSLLLQKSQSYHKNGVKKLKTKNKQTETPQYHFVMWLWVDDIRQIQACNSQYGQMSCEHILYILLSNEQCFNFMVSCSIKFSNPQLQLCDGSI